MTQAVAGIQGSPSPEKKDLSVTKLLYTKAYTSIWQGRAIKIWEWIFWVPFAVLLGLRPYEYYHPLFDSFMTALCWVFFWTVPVLVIPVWVHRVHVMSGTLNESLRPVPLHPGRIIFPRILAVGVTSLQMFLPAILIVLIDPTLLERFHMIWDESIAAIITNGVAMVGWLVFLIMWGFTSAGMGIRWRINFYFLYVALLVILILAPFLGPYFSYGHFDHRHVAINMVLSPLFLITGFAGLLLSPLFFWISCLLWVGRKR